MLQQALFVSSGVLVVSLVTRLFGDPDASSAEQSGDLIQMALHWRDVAAQDTDAALRLQHASTAAAYVHAARALTRDDALDRTVGLDVARLARHMDKRVVEARQFLRPEAPVPLK